MAVVLWLLALQGVIGAFDTAYYHEWRARLPGLGASCGVGTEVTCARGDAFYGCNLRDTAMVRVARSMDDRFGKRAWLQRSS